MSAPPVEAVTVFDIERECGAKGCSKGSEVALVAQLAGGGFAMRWVCRRHEAGAVPDGLAEVVIVRAPSPSEVDPLAALCEIVSEAGLTMTLYGHPVSEDALRTFATVKAFDRLGGAEPDDEADADLARALTAGDS